MLFYIIFTDSSTMKTTLQMENHLELFISNQRNKYYHNSHEAIEK